MAKQTQDNKDNKKTKINDQQLEEDDDFDVMESFKAFDRNGDGFLDRFDIRRVLYKLGVTLTDDELDEVVQYADKNNDGLIDFKEFQTMMMMEEKPAASTGMPSAGRRMNRELSSTDLVPLENLFPKSK